MKNTHIYKNIILYFHSSIVMLVWSRRAIGESSHIQRNCWESEQPVGIDFSQNSRPYIVLKLPPNLHTMLIFHWPLLTPLNCLFFLGHSLHPCIACFSLVIAYTLALLVLHWSLLTSTHCLLSSNHFVDFIYGLMYLSTTSAGLIMCQGDILHKCWLFFPGHNLTSEMTLQPISTFYLMIFIYISVYHHHFGLLADFLDSLSPFISIVHHFWQIL